MYISPGGHVDIRSNGGRKGKQAGNKGKLGAVDEGLVAIVCEGRKDYSF